MTFDIVKYTEDKIKEKVTFCDDTLNVALAKVLESANVAVKRSGTIYVATTGVQVSLALEGMNIRGERDAFYDYCERLGMAVWVSDVPTGAIPMSLSWTLQSLEEAKKLKEETL